MRRQTSAFQPVSEVSRQLDDTAYDNVVIVKNNIDSVNAVATNITAINTLNTNITDIIAINGNNEDISIVADNIIPVTTVSTNISSVNTTSSNIININTVASDLLEPVSEINTVANSIINVDTVGNSISNVNTVSTNIASVNTTAANIANVNIVALDLAEPVSEIDTVANSITNIDTVGTNITNVNTVATNITNVNTTATNITNINSVVTNIVPNLAEILLADDNAATATAQANLAIAAYDAFDERYLGAKAVDPTLDNDGNSLVEGALYDSTVAPKGLKYYDGTNWNQVNSGVTLDTAQSITAVKTFTASPLVPDATLITQAVNKGQLDTKVDKVTGKQLSTEDYTTIEKTKLSGIQENAEVNINADWNSITGDSQILNKPTIPTATSQLTNDSGFIDNTYHDGTKQNTSEKGQANGYASLDAAGIVPSTQLPSYVDDVLEYATKAALPVTGATGIIYVVVADESAGGDTSTYRWTGSVYAMVSNTLTAADVKTLYESNANTNEFSDAEEVSLSKLVTTAITSVTFNSDGTITIVIP